MTGIVKIGSKEVGMTANAASPYLFKQIFHTDFLQETQKKDFDSSIVSQMGFVMAKQSETSKTSELLKLNEIAYIEWLIQFEATDIISAADDILTLYMGQTLTSSVPKNEAE